MQLTGMYHPAAISAKPRENLAFYTCLTGNHLPIGQVPGVSQGAGVDSVLAVASIETGPSAPLMTAATRQR